MEALDINFEVICGRCRERLKFTDGDIAADVLDALLHSQSVVDAIRTYIKKDAGWQMSEDGASVTCVDCLMELSE